MNLSIEERIFTLAKYYKLKYGQKVYKLGLSTQIDCPQRLKGSPCIFCSPDSFIENELAHCKSITEQIDYLSGKLIAKFGNIGFSAYFQDNTSTYGDPEYLESLFLEADQHSLIKELVISTRPDYLNESILEIIKKLKKPVTVEIGIQTIHDKSLTFLRRGHLQINNAKAIELLNKYQIRTGAHLILGIPGETKEDILATIDWINEQHISEVKFHHLVVYKDTELEQAFKETKLSQAYNNLAEYCELLGMIIQRLNKDCVISRFFTSNLIQDRSSLNQFPGIKKKWLNELTKTLNKNNIKQGEN